MFVQLSDVSFIRDQSSEPRPLGFQSSVSIRLIFCARKLSEHKFLAFNLIYFNQQTYEKYNPKERLKECYLCIKYESIVIRK